MLNEEKVLERKESAGWLYKNVMQKNQEDLAYRRGYLPLIQVRNYICLSSKRKELKQILVSHFGIYFSLFWGGGKSDVMEKRSIYYTGNSLAVQWLGCHTSNARGLGSIPGRGTKIPQAAWWGLYIHIILHLFKNINGESNYRVITENVCNNLSAKIRFNSMWRGT